MLMGGSRLIGASLCYYEMKTFEVGVGRDHLYVFPPWIELYGWQLKTMLNAYHEMNPQPKTLAVFPEGIAVNYHLRIPSPLTELEHTPLALSYAGPQYVLAELKATPPSAVFLHSRSMTEFGSAYFGADEASGHDIMLWLKDNYFSAGHANYYTDPTNNSITRHDLDFFILKPAPN